MNITNLDPHHLPPLYDLYCDMVAPAPHCAPLPTFERFSADLLTPVPEQTRLLVAERAGVAVGMAALGVMAEDEDHDAGRDAIVALVFDDEATGMALLGACATRVSSGNVLAFPAAHELCPIRGYNSGWNGIPDRVALVGKVLATSGFTPYHRELHLNGDLQRLSNAASAPPSGLELRERMGVRGRPLIEAFDGETIVGGCIFGGLDWFSNDPATATIGVIWALWVEEPYRRRGLARALMLAALARLRASNCTSCRLTTTADNWRAQRLYLGMGFSVVDCSSSWRRDL